MRAKTSAKTVNERAKTGAYVDSGGAGLISVAKRVVVNVLADIVQCSNGGIVLDVEATGGGACPRHARTLRHRRLGKEKGCEVGIPQLMTYIC